MRLFTCLLVLCLVLTLGGGTASACDYGAARLYAAPQASFGYAGSAIGYSYAQPAPVFAPSCNCAPAAAPLPSYSPCGEAALAPVATPYSTGYGIARSTVVGYGHGYGGVAASRGVVVARDVGYGYGSFGVSRGVVVRQRGFYAGTARGFGTSRGVVVAAGGTAVAVRGASVVASPGAQVDVRRGLFGATRVRVR
jgi:hypothetical protein